MCVLVDLFARFLFLVLNPCNIQYIDVFPQLVDSWGVLFYTLTNL